MKLAELTWPDIESLSREVVVLIPTGSIEQHGAHLPLATDTILATDAAEQIEAVLPDKTLLTPCLWLGASLHHLPFPGSLSATFEGYDSALTAVVRSLLPAGFYKFMTINGHGGNADSNRITFRRLKSDHPHLQLAAPNYYDFIDPALLSKMLRGSTKSIRHACEVETSLMMHRRPDLVRPDRIRDDGREPTPRIPGLITQFDEITEQGSLGEATLASAETGRILWDSAIRGGTQAVEAMHDGIIFLGSSAESE